MSVLKSYVFIDVMVTIPKQYLLLLPPRGRLQEQGLQRKDGTASGSISIMITENIIETFFGKITGN